MPACPSCGQENPEGFRICGMCGTPLAEAPAPQATRKSVTVLFCDVAGYTAAGERLDPEALRNLQSRYFDVARAALERHGAAVEKFIGDAVMAVFGIPQLHEDDALRAARAALELHAAVSDLELETRIGVATGEVVAGSGEALVTGDAVNVAARLEQLAPPGAILVDQQTYRLVAGAVAAEPVEPLEMKGKAQPVAAWRLLDVRAGAEAVTRRLDRPLIGRRNELRLLRDAFDRTVRERACHLVTVLGSAGVGKSRLVAEFLAGLGDDVTVARGRCLSYGEGITFWPFAEAVREVLAAEGDELRRALDGVVADEPVGERVATLVTEAIGLDAGSATTEETFWAFRKLFEALARRRSLVLVLDDIQWGEPTFIDLVEHLADWTREAPVLLVCMARPELLDLRPGWGGGKLNATTFLLEPLVEDEAKVLIENLLGGELPPEAASTIATAAEGNALFVEEMVGMLIDDGLLVRRNGGWSVAGDLSSVKVPPSIRVLLAARIDRLPESDRIVLERAAVEGQVFHAGAVAELAPTESPVTVETSLLALVRRELVRPERGTFADEEAFRFRHLLIRDAAYDALPKTTRAELHERYAGWLESKAGDRAAEYAEIVGYHLEQAYRFRTELWPGDERARELGTRAGGWLRGAGERALSRGDAVGATRLLAHASELAEDDERVEILEELGTALGDAGRLADARASLREAIDGARRSGNRLVEWRALMQDAWWRMNTVDASADEVEPLVREGIAVLEELGDDYGLALAWRTLSDVHNMRGAAGAWIESLLSAFEHAHRAGDRQEEVVCVALVGGSMFFGPTPADEAIERLTAIREQVGDDPLLEAAVLRPLGGFVGLQGRLDEGRELVRRARETFADLRLYWLLGGIAFMSGQIELLAGDLEAAEREYRWAYELFGDIGEKGRRSTFATQLADVLYEQGRHDEAEELARTGAELGHEEDVDPQATSRAVRGKVLARRGHVDEGERLVREAVELIDPSERLLQAARLRLDLAEVLELGGRPDEASSYVEEARSLYERKGNLVMVERLQARLGC